MSEDMNEQFAATFQNFLRKCRKLGKKIHKDTQKCIKLIHALDDKTNFNAVIVQRAEESQDFLKEAHAFSQAILTWTEDYPKVLKQFNEILHLIINLLRTDDFVVVREYPIFSISFKEKTFDYKLNQLANQHQTDSDKLTRLEEGEKKVVTEMAEIISMEFKILKVLEDIESKINNGTLKDDCLFILSKEKDKSLKNASCSGLFCFKTIKFCT